MASWRAAAEHTSHREAARQRECVERHDVRHAAKMVKINNKFGETDARRNFLTPRAWWSRGTEVGEAGASVSEETRKRDESSSTAFRAQLHTRQAAATTLALQQLYYGTIHFHDGRFPRRPSVAILFAELRLGPARPLGRVPL